MQRKQAGPLLAGILFLSGLPLPAQPLSCDALKNGIAWKKTGVWKNGAATLSPMDPVDFSKPLTSDAVGEITVLSNAALYRKTCTARTSCQTTCSALARPEPGHPPAKPLTSSFFAAIALLGGRPGFRDAMSKSSVWTDSLAGFEGNAADLAPVFEGTRNRKIVVRICPIDRNAACVYAPRTVDWNGKSAILTGPEVRSGLFRVVEGEDEQDAWVRLVPQNKLRAMRAQYDDAVAALSTWSLPDDIGTAPNLERLRRFILAAVEENR
jgi:hypothetical protein